MVWHPIFVHFSIGLLATSLLLTPFSKRFQRLVDVTWWLLVLGTIATIPTTLTGIIDHLPYEETILHDVIENHQLLGFATTAMAIILLVWRWFSRRRGNDVGSHVIYMIVCLVCFGLLFVTGLTGGDLVYEYAVNVNGINPLQP